MDRQNIDLLYLIDMAEIPAFQEKPLVDLNGNGTVEASEEDAYLSRKAGELTEGLVVKLNGTRYLVGANVSQQLELVAGRVEFADPQNCFELPTPPERRDSSRMSMFWSTRIQISQDDAGWKEIVVQGDGIEESSVSGVDKSQQLTHYPEDPAIRPPEDLERRVRFKSRHTTGHSASAASHSASGRSATEPAEFPSRGCGRSCWRCVVGRLSCMALVFKKEARVIMEDDALPFRRHSLEAGLTVKGDAKDSRHR